MTVRTDSTRPAPASAAARAVRALEDATTLDAVTAVGDRLSAALTADPRVRDALRGAWMGHAVHPIAVQVPLGTWLSASLLDVVGGEGSADAARVLTGAGVLAAVPAAVTGWAEYGQAGRTGRRVAVVHAGANAAGLGLQAASWTARRAGNRRTGALLGLVAMGVAGAAGHLGGHLTAARKVASHDPAFGPEPDAPSAR